MSYIPLEILETIVNELHDHPSSLRVCAAASRAFLHSSRTHLFANIRLLPFPDVQNPALLSRSRQVCMCKKFYALLHSAPHLAPYVRKLEVVDGRVFPQLKTWEGPSMNGPPWVMEEETLGLVLQKLIRLKSLSLGFQDGPRRVWSHMPRTLRDSLLNAFRLPSMRHIKLKNIAFHCPTEVSLLFDECTGLKNLTLSSVWLLGTDPAKPDRYPNHQIEDLTLSTAGEWHTSFLAAMDLTHLRMLHLPTINICELGPLIKIVETQKLSINSLTHLSLANDFSIPFCAKPFSLDVDLGSFTNLKSLHMGLTVVDFAGKQQSSVLWFVRLLASLPPQAPLEEVIMALRMTNVGFDIDDWRALDAVLAHPKFTSLRHLVLELHHLCQGVVDDMLMALASSCAKGVVRVQSKDVVSKRGISR